MRAMPSARARRAAPAGRAGPRGRPACQPGRAGTSCLLASPAMTASRWDRAGSLPVPVRGRPRPELASLPPDDLPTLAQLFTFMRDAELRFETLRMRIEEQTATTLGDQTFATDVWLRHPGWARMLTADPD